MSLQRFLVRKSLKILSEWRVFSGKVTKSYYFGQKFQHIIWIFKWGLWGNWNLRFSCSEIHVNPLFTEETCGTIRVIAVSSIKRCKWIFSPALFIDPNNSNFSNTENARRLSKRRRDEKLCPYNNKFRPKETTTIFDNERIVAGDSSSALIYPHLVSCISSSSSAGVPHEAIL